VLIFVAQSLKRWFWPGNTALDTLPPSLYYELLLWLETFSINIFMLVFLWLSKVFRIEIEWSLKVFSLPSIYHKASLSTLTKAVPCSLQKIASLLADNQSISFFNWIFDIVFHFGGKAVLFWALWRSTSKTFFLISIWDSLMWRLNSM